MVYIESGLHVWLWGPVEMAERSKAAASGAVPLRRARVRTSLSIMRNASQIRDLRECPQSFLTILVSGILSRFPK